MKPFVKWAGGKREQAERILEEVPAGMDAYGEPLVGGGAVYFKLCDQGWDGPSALGDANVHLINAYTIVRDRPEELIRALKGFVNDRVRYDRTRDKFNAGHGDPVWRAAALIYMNKTCFNGLYRVNKSGAFDSPFGAFTNPTICDGDGILSASKALKRATLHAGKFDAMVMPAGKKPFVYFDPPYLTLPGKDSFSAYDMPFGEGSTRWLALHARQHVRAGARVAVSSSDVAYARTLYEEVGFRVYKVKSKRNINSDGAGRGHVTELLAVGG